MSVKTAEAWQCAPTACHEHVAQAFKQQDMLRLPLTTLWVGDKHACLGPLIIMMDELHRKFTRLPVPVDSLSLVQPAPARPAG